MYQRKNNYSIHAIPVLKDNIIWIWTDGSEAVVIDPAISQPVKMWLKQNNLKLTAVLQTHHHSDHIGGTQELLMDWPEAEVVASKADLKRIPFQTISVKNGTEFVLMRQPLIVIDVPGHTNAHVAYYVPYTNRMSPKPSLFCGDALFGAGCGRLFEGSAETMFKSLGKLKQLPESTQIYCAHEYTVANLRWAHEIYPDNELISKRLTSTIKKRAEGLLSLPSSLEEEKKTNLFIRAKTIEEFKRLRLHKDNW